MKDRPQGVPNNKLSGLRELERIYSQMQPTTTTNDKIAMEHMAELMEDVQEALAEQFGDL